MAAYATGDDLVNRYDIDIVGDLTSDNRDPMNRSAIPTHTGVLTALLDASGEVDISLATGGRYTAQQLESLTGNSQNKLKRITCDIAMSLLLQRRVDPRYQELAEQVAKISRAHLAALQRGENVFGLPDLQGAGNIDLATMSIVDIENNNLLPARMTRYFPGSLQRLPRGS